MKTNRANDLTKAVIQYLSLNGWKVWRYNNVGVWDAKKGVHRKSKMTLKGVPDVIGFHKTTGIFGGFEIKVGKDRLSPEQKQFLDELESANGIGLVIRDEIGDLIRLYKEALKVHPRGDELRKTIRIFYIE